MRQAGRFVLDTGRKEREKRKEGKGDYNFLLSPRKKKRAMALLHSPVLTYAEADFSFFTQRQLRLEVVR